MEIEHVLLKYILLPSTTLPLFQKETASLLRPTPIVVG